MVNASLKYVVFLAVIIIGALVLGTAISFSDFLISNVYWLIILAIFLYVIWKYDFILQLVDYQRAVIYRFGKVNRVGGPGWTFLWPVIEKSEVVDLRTKTIDVPKQDVVTKDGIELNVDAVIYLKIKKDRQSVVNSVIEVEDYAEASRLYVISALRDALGTMVLSEIISNIEIVNAQIKENLERLSKDWGVEVDAVEIKDVQIPETVLNAMHQEKAAVQQKLARMEKALAHKAEIEAVKDAAKGLDSNALSYYYIKAIENMSNSKGSKVFFPAEFSKLAQAFSSSQLEKIGESKDVGEYKKLLENYIETAVSKSKKVENKKTSVNKKPVKKKSVAKKKIVKKKTSNKKSSIKKKSKKNKKK